jgi:hypothetical protein
MSTSEDLDDCLLGSSCFSKPEHLLVDWARLTSRFALDSLQHAATKPTMPRLRRVTSFMPNNVNHDSMLQEAITTIQDAFFDPQKFNFMDMFSAASKQSRLAYFISDKDVLFAIEQDLSNFRTALQKQGVRGGDEMDDEMGSSSDKALLSLKSAIERLHLTLKKDVNAPDRISQAMIEEAIMDLAAAVEQGNDDEREVNGFIASHSSVIASVLKSSIAVLYEELLDGDMEDVQVLDFTAISFHFANNPTKAMTIMPGTTAGSTNKEYTVMPSRMTKLPCATFQK